MMAFIDNNDNHDDNVKDNNDIVQDNNNNRDGNVKDNNKNNAKEPERGGQDISCWPSWQLLLGWL